MTDITQSPGDRLRFEILLKSLTEGTMNLAVLSQHDMVLDFYGNLFDERLRARGETDVEFCFSTNSETLVQKFNEILSDLTLNEALEKEKKLVSRRYLIFRDSILMQDFELQLLARLVNGFPASNITVILLINSAGNYRTKLEAFGKNLLQWEVETKAGEAKQPLTDWVAQAPPAPPHPEVSDAPALADPTDDELAPASKLFNVPAKPSWRIPGFGNNKKEPVLEPVVPAATALATHTSMVQASQSAPSEALPGTDGPAPTLQDIPREPGLLSETATTQAMDQAAAPTLFEKPPRRMPWGWVLLALLLSAAVFAYMHRDALSEEAEQFKKYLLRGTPAVAMTPEDVASAQAAAQAASEAAAQAASEAEAQALQQAIGATPPASAAAPMPVSEASSAPAASAAPAASSAPAASAPSAAARSEPASAPAPAVASEGKASLSKKAAASTDEAWVRQLGDNSFVLQLAAADTEADILKFKNSDPIYANARVMSAPKKDSAKRYFILVAGPFENKTDADTYVNSHPLLSKGWLRNAKSMRNQFLRTQP